MSTGIDALDQAYEILFVGALIVLALLLIGCLVRAIMGPRVADRLVAVNMMGTIVMSIIAILTVMMGEGYLGDICLIYAMLSFLAVIILSKVYIGVYREHKEHERAKAAANPKKTAQGAGVQGEAVQAAVVQGKGAQGAGVQAQTMPADSAQKPGKSGKKAAVSSVQAADTRQGG